MIAKCFMRKGITWSDYANSNAVMSPSGIKVLPSTAPVSSLSLEGNNEGSRTSKSLQLIATTRSRQRGHTFARLTSGVRHPSSLPPHIDDDSTQDCPVRSSVLARGVSARKCPSSWVGLFSCHGGQKGTLCLIFVKWMRDLQGPQLKLYLESKGSPDLSI